MKYLILIWATIALTACTTKDESYYRMNPQALQEAIKNCPNEQPPQLSCEKLAPIAANINDLAYQLQINPQAFGQAILALQEQLGKQQEQLQENKDQPELKKIIERDKAQLAARLAIVKWLESPES